MFVDGRQFAFVEAIERRWEAIRDEYVALVKDQFFPWPEEQIYYNERGIAPDKSWNVFPLYAFRKLEVNCARCPVTAEVIESIPRMTLAGFSVLAPGTELHPHCGYEGYSTAVLRLHLGLVVPDGCAIRVGSETRSWQAGKCLIFDDMVEHQAWNRGESERAVLLLDFVSDEKLEQLRAPLGLQPGLRTVMERLQLQIGGADEAGRPFDLGKML